MGFQEFNAQLKEDVHNIKIVAAQCDGLEAQIGRIQSIIQAGSYCLAQLMGAMAAAHWLRIVADGVERQAKGHVH